MKQDEKLKADLKNIKQTKKYPPLIIWNKTHAIDEGFSRIKLLKRRYVNQFDANETNVFHKRNSKIDSN